MTVEAQTSEMPPADPLGLADTEPEPRRRRRRSLLVDREAARQMLADVRAVIDERQAWNDARLARYAKFRGWLDAKVWPFPNASNHHWPMLLEKVLRNEAGLFNALLSQRPVVEATATRKVAVGKTQPVTDLLDSQWFGEDDGEAKLDRLTQQDVQDGTVLMKSYWVRDRREVPDVRRADRDPSLSKLAQLAALLPDYVEGEVLDAPQPLDPEGDRWRLVVRRPGEVAPSTVTAEVYDVVEADAVIGYETVLTGLRTIDEGPSSQILPLEAFLVPLRSENPHPVSPRNPKGARWVAHREFVALADLERGRAAGRYTFSDDDWAAIEAAAEGPVPTDTTRDHEDAAQRAKEAQAGFEAGPPANDPRGQWGVWVVEYYGPRVVHGVEQEMVDWLVEKPAIPIGAKYLTEVMPGLPLKRPFAKAEFIPVPGQFYGMSLLEVLEKLNDLQHALINQALDSGTLANIPFGFARATSQMKAETLRIEPGVIHFLDNPQQDVYFPPMQGKDQSFNLNMTGIVAQEADKISAAGPMQQGMVPTGKASALRTAGTTLAILSEGAAQPQQILRRLFTGLTEMFAHRHRLNIRYLPPRTAYRKRGFQPEDPEGFGEIGSRSDLDLPLDFSFQASLLNANKGLVAQSLEAIMAAVVNPIAAQLGILTPDGFYRLLRDYIKAHEQDPTRYIGKPAGASDADPIYAEEAMDRILAGQRVPEGIRPYEDPQEHLAKLMGYLQAPEVQSAILPLGAQLAADWITRVQQQIMQTAMQQAVLAQGAGAFGPAQQGGGEGPGGTMTTMQSPGMQTNAPTDDEAANSGQPGAQGGA